MKEKSAMQKHISNLNELKQQAQLNVDEFSAANMVYSRIASEGMVIAYEESIKQAESILAGEKKQMEDIWDEGFRTGHIQVTNKLGSNYLIQEKNRALDIYYSDKFE